ncbi:MAG: hypothetical protein ACFFDG_13845 [Promethearchaeota archaeon]
MNYLERNYNLIKERMIQQMENSFILGRKLIDSEVDTGLLNFIVKPLIKTFYDYWSKNEAKSGTLKQIRITLDCGKEILLNGKTDQSFNKTIDDNFLKYLANDQTYLQCSKSHKNYEKLKNVAKSTFKNYLKEVVKLLEVEDEVENYGDLCRVAFPAKEIAEQNLMNQLEYTDKGIQIVEEDPSILKVPVGRKIIVKALRKGFEETKAEFIKALDETYNQK